MHHDDLDLPSRNQRRMYGDDPRTWVNPTGIGFAKFGQFRATEGFSGSPDVRKPRARAQISIDSP